MSRTTMIIIITVAIAILYLTYDAVRRSREKKLPYVFKRKYHQFEGWLNVTALGLTIDALIIPWDIAWTGTWNTILFGGTALLSANFLYAYEMEYFSIHSDGTIKYHTRTGKIITTHFNKSYQRILHSRACYLPTGEGTMGTHPQFRRPGSD